MASNNVVAACTANLAKHTQATFTAQYGAAATPAAVANACGYPGSSASAWRKHLARQHGAGVVANGGTRYPALTYPQWCKLLGLVAKASTASTPAAAKAGSGGARKLWLGVYKAKPHAAGMAGAATAKAAGKAKAPKAAPVPAAAPVAPASTPAAPAGN